MNITQELAHDIARAAARPLPAPVALMAQQSFLNVLATTIGAAADPAVAAAVRYGQRYGTSPTVPIPGTGTSLDPLRAATTLGLAAHVDDFDDTHLATVIHPGAAALAATFAVGIPHRSTGEQMLRAFALGCEVQLRAGVTMTPWHYDRGWHITGTCAPLGAAVTAILLAHPDPDPDLIERALALAASMSLGQREAFGSMIKSYHPGKGAANGVLAASLAPYDVSIPPDALGGRDGYFAVLSTHHVPARLTSEFGQRWELLDNTFKPYPCGIVCHPAIDAAIDLWPHVAGHLDVIADVRVLCHPLVQELTGNPHPRTGLQAKFSTIHGVAAGLVDGHVALPQYTDARVQAEDIDSVRSRVRLVVDPDRHRDSARVEVDLVDGQTFTADIPHARGSIARPLSTAELHAKARELIDARLPGAAEAIIAAVSAMPDADSPDHLVATIGASSPAPIANDRVGVEL